MELREGLSQSPPSQAFAGRSAGKESTCNTEDPDSIPGLGRSPGEGIGYPLQYSWASLVAKLAKNLPAMWETWVRSLGLEDSPGEGKGYPLQYSGLGNSMDCIAHEVAKSRTQLSSFHFTATPVAPLSLQIGPSSCREASSGLPLILHYGELYSYYISQCNRRNNVHNKCNVLESSPNHPPKNHPPSQVHEKIAFHKINPRGQKDWGPLP